MCFGFIYKEELKYENQLMTLTEKEAIFKPIKFLTSNLKDSTQYHLVE